MNIHILYIHIIYLYIHNIHWVSGIYSHRENVSWEIYEDQTCHQELLEICLEGGGEEVNENHGDFFFMETKRLVRFLKSIKNWTGPYQRTPKLLELLDTQVYGSVQWVLLEISWIEGIPNVLGKSEHFLFSHVVL